MMRIGDQLQISINNSCQVQGTVTDIKTIGENGKRCLLVTCSVPGYGYTQPFMMPLGANLHIIKIRLQGF